MAVLQKAVFADASTYTTFAAWAQFMFNAFTTFGWVQTADFGQVNWTNLAASNVVPLTSSNSSFTPSGMVAESISGTITCSAGSGQMVIPIATTTNYVAGRSVALSTMSASTSGLNGYIFTILSVVASTSITVACPTTGSSPLPWAAGFSYATQTGTATPTPAFAIFESQDTLTSSCPIYVKMEWAGYTTGVQPWCRLSVGTGGTTGFGSLGTSSFILNNQAAYAQSTNQLHPCYASGDSGCIRFGMFLPTGADGNIDSYSPMLFVVARSRDNNGNQSTSYVMAWSGFSEGAGTSGAFQTVFPTGSGTLNVVDTTGYFIAAIGHQTTGALGGITMVAPMQQNVGGLSNPTPDLLACYYPDFPYNTFATITVYGVSHNYISVRGVTGLVSIGAASAANSGFLMRFD